MVVVEAVGAAGLHEHDLHDKCYDDDDDDDDESPFPFRLFSSSMMIEYREILPGSYFGSLLSSSPQLLFSPSVACWLRAPCFLPKTEAQKDQKSRMRGHQTFVLPSEPHLPIPRTDTTMRDHRPFALLVHQTESGVELALPAPEYDDEDGNVLHRRGDRNAKI